ncbi:hypothetical protein K2X30_01365 [bacterium]|nr:hypothetical protein [bacterium]
MKAVSVLVLMGVSTVSLAQENPCQENEKPSRCIERIIYADPKVKKNYKSLLSSQQRPIDKQLEDRIAKGVFKATDPARLIAWTMAQLYKEELRKTIARDLAQRKERIQAGEISNAVFTAVRNLQELNSKMREFGDQGRGITQTVTKELLGEFEKKPIPPQDPFETAQADAAPLPKSFPAPDEPI